MRAVKCRMQRSSTFFLRGVNANIEMTEELTALKSFKGTKLWKRWNSTGESWLASPPTGLSVVGASEGANRMRGKGKWRNKSKSTA